VRVNTLLTLPHSSLYSFSFFTPSPYLSFFTPSSLSLFCVLYIPLSLFLIYYVVSIRHSGAACFSSYPFVRVRRVNSVSTCNLTTCDACGRSHQVSHELVLGGVPYDAFTFHHSSTWYRGIEEPALTCVSHQRSSSTVTYLLGSTCQLKAHLYHIGWHFKYRLFRRIQSRLLHRFENVLEDFLLYQDQDDGNDSWRDNQFKIYKRYLKLIKVRF